VLLYVVQSTVIESVTVEISDMITKCLVLHAQCLPTYKLTSSCQCQQLSSNLVTNIHVADIV